MWACGGADNKPKPVGELARVAELRDAFLENLEKIEDFQDQYGWIATEHCDAALWSGKLGTLPEITINYRAAEYPGERGRFNRRPDPFCEAGAGSATSWSRDMGLGLMAYAWRKKDLSIVKDHAAYGNKKFWKMGEPLDDGRVLYTPPMIGILYQVIWALGGEDNASRVWPAVYPKGLNDYEAHLQMIGIWLRGEIAEKKGTNLFDLTTVRGAFLTDTSDTALDRIKEHAGREPLCPFYQYMHGLYVGNLQGAIDLLLSPDNVCEYYRANDPSSQLGEWLFSAYLTLERGGG